MTVIRDTAPAVESAISGVSWAAVIAGAVVAAASSLALLALGSGLGLAAMSPWAGEGASATTLGIGAVIWMLIVHAVAAAAGGFIAGRLRTRWTTIHTDEVYFRDTAHGFIVWALSVVISASMLAAAAAVMVSSGSQVAAGAAASSEGRSGSIDYAVDVLLRSDKADAAPANDFGQRREIGRTLTRGLAAGNLPAADRTYLARVVSARTGLPQADAERRVDEVVVQAKTAADTARKAAAGVSIWSFISLLIGAFSASLAATFGGRCRDRAELVR